MSGFHILNSSKTKSWLAVGDASVAPGGILPAAPVFFGGMPWKHGFQQECAWGVPTVTFLDQPVIKMFLALATC